MSNTPRNIGVFIISWNRARFVEGSSIQTYDLMRALTPNLAKHIVVSSIDPDLERYQEAATERGFELNIFDETIEAPKYETCEAGTPAPRCGGFGRNNARRIAHELGYTHVVLLDDDYSSLRAWSTDRRHDSYMRWAESGEPVLESIIQDMAEIVDTTPVNLMCLAQGGDWIGGGAGISNRWKRKSMNFFVERTDRWAHHQEIGLANDDVSLYTMGARDRGIIALTSMLAGVIQGQTQSNSGGMTELYLDIGTVRKSLYSIVQTPSAVTLNVLASPNKHPKTGNVSKGNPRIHHRVNYDRCAPKLVRPRTDANN